MCRTADKMTTATLKRPLQKPVTQTIDCYPTLSRPTVYPQLMIGNRAMLKKHTTPYKQQYWFIC